MCLRTNWLVCSVLIKDIVPMLKKVNNQMLVYIILASISCQFRAISLFENTFSSLVFVFRKKQRVRSHSPALRGHARSAKLNRSIAPMSWRCSRLRNDQLRRGLPNEPCRERRHQAKEHKRKLTKKYIKIGEINQRFIHLWVHRRNSSAKNVATEKFKCFEIKNKTH